MYSIETLVSEHENVRRLNRVMRIACLDILAGGTLSPDDFRLFISFIRNYADKHHHGKEELFLFKEMQDRLGDGADKLIRNGMLVEHELGRLYVKQLEDGLTSYENGDEDSKLDILTNAMAYADLLKRHIDRENNAVFIFAEKNLPHDVLETLNEQTRDFEVEHGESRDMLLASLDKLEEKYIK